MLLRTTVLSGDMLHVHARTTVDDDFPKASRDKAISLAVTSQVQRFHVWLRVGEGRLRRLLESAFEQRQEGGYCRCVHRCVADIRHDQQLRLRQAIDECLTCA